jgi:hypothetical protein
MLNVWMIGEVNMNNTMIWLKTKNSTYEIFKCNMVDGTSFYALLSIDSNAFNDDQKEGLRADFIKLSNITVINERLNFTGTSYHNCKLSLDVKDPENPIYIMERKNPDIPIIPKILDSKVTTPIETLKIVNREQTVEMIKSGGLVITGDAYKRAKEEPIEVSDKVIAA